MASVNKAIVLGNLGRDPEVRRTGDGRAIANVTVATSENWKDRNTGERQERTEWHRISVFGPLAEIVEKYLKKGDSVYFEGRIQTRKWTDNNNQERYTTEIVVDQGGVMQMLGKRGGNGGGGYDSAPASSGGGYSQQAAPAPAAAPKKISTEEPFDDEIPF